MRLIKCYIENFGLLHTSEFSFSKGLNCCLSDNGTGKTTLTAFIEAMLYGIGDTRRQALDENPRKKYAPWQGGRFGGSLTVEIGKKQYVIERSFGARPADDTFRLLDADSGRVSTDYGEDIGESLFGIDRDGFLRTVFLSERNLTGKNENKSISAKLSDLVGVDGDVGEFDDALKLLEDRRKFYFKKGNTGEIANVKERINECKRRIDGIAALEAEARTKQERLGELNTERIRLEKLEAEQKQKLETLRKQREKSSHEERYGAMLRSLEDEKARLAVAKEFFAAGVPTTVEIDGARDAYVEAERLKLEALSERGNEEYVALGEFFKSGTSFVEIAEMERSAELALEKARELDSIENGSDAATREMLGLFPGGAPSRDELERAEKTARRKISLGKCIALITSVALAVIGLVLGGGVGYTLSGIGSAAALITVILTVKAGKSKELLSFIRKYNGCECSGVKGAIEEIKTKLARAEELGILINERRETLAQQRDGLTVKVCSFLEKFPITDAESIYESVCIIKHKYTQYYALGQTGALEENGKLAKLKRSESLAGAASDFLAKFPTVTAAPFAEIRDRLNEYVYLKAGVERLERECDVFAVKYGVTGKTSFGDQTSEAAVSAALAELGERISALKTEAALVDRELNAALAEIEKRDEHEMAKEELEELYTKHVESLDIIKKTSLYLKEACDNITSKYLGKTKESFEKYSALIAGAEGDYTLNTSFELARTERGESHGIESYSRGTRDLYSLCLRIALVDALYDKESPFIILDDPFIALDDGKLERAKAMLKELGKTKQILYFTCSLARKII